jgi:hypothetical protein
MRTDSAVPLQIRQAFAACRQHFVAAAAFSALVNILYLAPTIYMMQVYDRVVPTGGVLTLFWITVIVALAIACLSALDMVRSRLMLRASLRLNRQLAAPILDRLALTGGDKTRIATLTSIAISIAMLIILELLATFSGDGAAILRRAWMARASQAASAQRQTPVPAAPSPTKPAKAVANRAYYLGRLEREFPALAVRVHTGELSVYRASMEVGLRKPPARNWAQPDTYRPKPVPSASKQTARRASPGKTLQLAASPK